MLYAQLSSKVQDDVEALFLRQEIRQRAGEVVGPDILFMMGDDEMHMETDNKLMKSLDNILKTNRNEILSSMVRRFYLLNGLHLVKYIPVLRDIELYAWLFFIFVYPFLKVKISNKKLIKKIQTEEVSPEAENFYLILEELYVMMNQKDLDPRFFQRKLLVLQELAKKNNESNNPVLNAAGIKIDFSMLRKPDALATLNSSKVRAEGGEVPQLPIHSAQKTKVSVDKGHGESEDEDMGEEVVSAESPQKKHA